MRWCSSHSFAIAGLLSAAVPPALAARLPFQRRDEPAHSTHLNFTNNADPFEFGVANFQGDGQTIYFVSIQVDGQDFEVVLDTGSADLWLDTTNITFSSNIANTGQNQTVPYGDGTVAEGPILVGEVKIGEFVVGKQAFMSAPGTNATSAGDQGLLGVGPPKLSVINQQLANTTYNGAPLLANLFSLYPNESNYITFMLNRSIFGVTDGGTFTIGEVDPNYAAIQNSTQLPVLVNSNQWLTIMDSVIVNGKNMSGGGLLDNTTDPVPAQFQHKLLTLLDTGTALATGPQSYVDAIYGNVTGAELIPDAGGFYKLPCDTKLNVSMVLGGAEFPVNPLDLVTVTTDFDNVTIICASTISYSDPRLSNDWILGDAFLRNVYSLYDYGSLTNANDSAPFIQILSLTDKEQAWANFDTAQQARVSAFQAVVASQTSPSPTGSAGTSTLVTATPSAAASSTPSAAIGNLKGDLATSGDSSQNDYSSLLRNSYIVIGLLAGVLVLLVALIVMQVMKSKQERKYQPLRNTGGPAYSSGKGSVYETPYDS